jgi:hypothetical protein
MRRLAVALLGLALFGPAGLGCSDSGRRDDGPPPVAPGGPLDGSGAARAADPPLLPPPDPDALTPADVAAISAAVCGTYADWPHGTEPGPSSPALSSVLAGLSDRQRARFEATDWIGVAEDACPDVMATLPSAGNAVPRPATALAGVPGFFGPSELATPEHDRARYELTATGLGCLSLRDGADQELREAEARFLSEMGYDRESYIAASLAQDDRALSARIFAAIRDCAQRMHRPSTLRQPE